MEQKEPGFRWDYAVTSEIDRIFPSENVNSYWEKQKLTRHIVVPLPHYFFHKWKSYTEFISFVEKHRKKRPLKSRVNAGVFKDL
jgi:hypothetical protein